jgi:hypothetical protein
MHHAYGHYRPHQQFHHGHGHHRGPMQHAYGHHGSTNTWGRPHMAASPSHQAGWQGRQEPPGWSQGNKTGW